MDWTAEDEQAWQEWQEMAAVMDCARVLPLGWYEIEPVLLPNEDSGYSWLQAEAVHYPRMARARGNVAP